MLEYVFFHPSTCQEFVDFLDGIGIDTQQSETDGARQVAIAEDIDDALMTRIEQRYEELMEQDQALIEQDDDDAHHAAGIVLSLAGGRSVYARVEPELLGRIMAVVSADEFSSVVDAIVSAVENPEERPLCKK